MPDSTDLLSTKYHRRILFASGIAALLAIGSLRFFIIPYFTKQPIQDLPSIISSILDSLMVALISSMVITALVLWLIPPSRQKALVKIIQPFELKDTLADALVQTTEFWYKGHTARWFRSITLPQLASDARSENVSKIIYLTILDPSNTRVCEYYAQYRQRLRSASKNDPWTAKRTRIELLATILSVYVWQSQEPSLNITIALTDKVSHFRVDLTSSMAIITKEDSREPALSCDSGSLFYRSYREDVLMSFQQSRQLPRNVKALSFSDMNNNNTKDLLNELNLDTSDFTDRDIAEIISLAKRPENPYP